jgi:hypothetical protein
MKLIKTVIIANYWCWVGNSWRLDRGSNFWVDVVGLRVGSSRLRLAADGGGCRYVCWCGGSILKVAVTAKVTIATAVGANEVEAFILYFIPVTIHPDLAND